MTPLIGYRWLIAQYAITQVQALPVQSEIGGARLTHIEGDIRREVYPEAYRPEDTLAGQLTFAFKYEGIHLECLTRLFAHSAVSAALEAWIATEPTGAYARRAGFYFEWLSARMLQFAGVTQGNYIDALNPDDYLTGHPSNNPRWRVRDNLPGTPAYCPLLRRTAEIQAAERYDIKAKLEALESDFGIDLIRRSTVWLTIKESRASFLIEHEQEQHDRIQRFAAVMETECGQQEEHPLSEDRLTRLQRNILGNNALRYGIRQSPIFVGHAADFQPVVDYIAPHWESVSELLSGLASYLERTTQQPALIRAAVAAFGFVYIHPMADGNGRISRFLINDILRRDGALPAPMILPVSAAITHSTRARADYDQTLERFSRPLMLTYAADYRFGETKTANDGVAYNLYFDAYEQAMPAWRYPDLTAHVTYLAALIDFTITREMPDEARILKANDTARSAIKSFLEAPDNELDAIIRSVRQNGHSISGQLAKHYPILKADPRVEQQILEAIAHAFTD